MPMPDAVRGILRAMRRELLWCILGTIILGVAIPSVAVAVGQATVILVALMMVGLGLGLGLGPVRAVLRRWPRVFAIVGMQLVASLGLAWVLSYLVQSGSARAGLRALGAMPAEVMAGIMVQAAGGNLPMALAIVAASVLVSGFLLPLVVVTPKMTSVVFSPLETLGWVVLALLAPLGLAAAMREAEPRLAAWDEEAGGLAILSVLLLGFAAGGHAATHGSGERLEIAFLVLAFTLGGYAIGYGIARLLRADPGEARAILLTSGMREFGVAIGYSLAFLRGDAPMVAATYGVVLLILGPLFAQADRQGLLSRWLPRNGEERSDR